MDTVFEQGRILFPTAVHVGAVALPNVRGVRMIYNSDIASNGAQLQAIASILGLPAGSPPFCVFGPYVPRTQLPESSSNPLPDLEPAKP